MSDNAAIATAPLIDHIVHRYHQSHRQQLPELSKLAHKVETVHFGDPDVPEGLSRYLEMMIGALEEHMTKEEMILFPALRSGRTDAIGGPIAAMRAEHDDHAADTAAILALTQGLALPDGACRTWSILYEQLKVFLDDLDTHIRLENDVLFPRFECSRPTPSAAPQSTKS